ncbi:NAD(P)-binding protein [Xylariaceae sp. FL0016]|nr:NAD(P)-binding protein [Xylariaceae sp. FL0016]
MSTMFPDHASRLSYAVIEDITEPEAFAEVLAGVTGVIHCAAPLGVLAEDEPLDNTKDLLKPIIGGSLAILESIMRYGDSVHRVVATASFSGCLDLSKGQRPGYTYTDEDWNPMTLEQAQTSPPLVAYTIAKTAAERQMWAWMKRNKPRFTLSTILPPWVMGPYAAPSILRSMADLSSSPKSVWQNLVDAPAMPPFDFGAVVDTRDCAAAHILALETPGAADQRFLVGHEFQYRSVVADLHRSKHEVCGRLPDEIPGAPEIVYRLDVSKSERILVLECRPVRKTMQAMMSQILALEGRDRGRVPAARVKGTGEAIFEGFREVDLG